MFLARMETSGHFVCRAHFFYDQSGKVAKATYNSGHFTFLYNMQGDVVGLLDSTGAEVVKYTYDAWGRQLSKTGTLASTLGTIQPFRYRGYVYDDETGLYYLRSRYYNPTWGRFVNADVIAAGSKNLFTYCNNTPIGNLDLDGFITYSCLDLNEDETLKGIFGGSGGGNLVYHIDTTFASNSSLVDGGLYNSGYTVYYSYSSTEVNVPQNAYDVLNYVLAHNGTPMKGYKGGKTYKNIPVNPNDDVLPQYGMPYREYDIYPNIPGVNRGTERLVIGVKGFYFYTYNHYKSFIRIK